MIGSRKLLVSCAFLIHTHTIFSAPPEVLRLALRKQMAQLTRAQLAVSCLVNSKPFQLTFGLAILTPAVLIAGTSGAYDHYLMHKARKKQSATPTDEQSAQTHSSCPELSQTLAH